MDPLTSGPVTITVQVQDAAGEPYDGFTEPVVSVEHPSGEFSVTLVLDPADPQRVVRSALLRTARLLMSGEVLVPSSVWNPVAKERSA